MKKKIILYIASTLDGYIARKDGSVDWLSKYENTGEDYGYTKFYKSVSIVVMGNKTYKQALSFGEGYKDKKCFVFSRRKQTSTDKVAYVKNMKEFVEKVKKEKGNIWLIGGSILIDEFLKHDLIDELIISIIPTLLGGGIPLFRSKKVKKFKLVDVKSYKSGIVQMSYKA